MFDLTSSKLLILAVVALIVVGPKDLPALLRTVGRYMGMIRRQANEFRTQFEEAMRETELADLKKEVEHLGQETKATFDEAGRSIESHVGDIHKDVSDSLAEVDRAAAAQPALMGEGVSSTAPGAIEAAPHIPMAPPAATPRPVTEAVAVRGEA